MLVFSFAKDIIVKCTGETEYIYIFKISDTHVTYKLDTLSRVEYTVDKNKIRTIIFEGKEQAYVSACGFSNEPDVNNVKQASLNNKNAKTYGDHEVFSIRNIPYLDASWAASSIPGFTGFVIEAGLIKNRFYFTAEPSVGFVSYDYSSPCGTYLGISLNFGKYGYYKNNDKRVKTVFGGSVGYFHGAYIRDYIYITYNNYTTNIINISFNNFGIESFYKV
jgi:hypothetical protein